MRKSNEKSPAAIVQGRVKVEETVASLRREFERENANFDFRDFDDLILVFYFKVFYSFSGKNILLLPVCRFI